MRKELLWGLMAGLAAALPGAPTALRWTGEGGDFNFATAANWDGDAGAFASEEGVTLDLTDVPDGAVLTNDFTASKSCRLVGVTLAAGRTVELFGASASKSTLRLVKATTFTVPPGAELRFNLQMANPWAYGGLTHRIEGGGTFRFLSPLFVPWGCTFVVGAETTFCHDSTVFDVGGASALGQTAVTLADSTARLVLARDMAVAAVTCAADATPHIVLNGHVLRLTGGSGGNGFFVRGLEGAARITIKAQNIFSYCANLPVMLVDENGHRWKLWDGIVDYFANIGRGCTDVARSFEVDASINVGLAAETTFLVGGVPFTGSVGMSSDVIGVKMRDGKIESGGGYSIGAGITPAAGMARFFDTHIGVDCWHPYEYDESVCTCGLYFDKMPYCPLTEGGIGVASSISDTKSSPTKLGIGGNLTVGIGISFYMGVDIEHLWNSIINLGGALVGCPI